MLALVIDGDLRTLDAMSLLLSSWGWSTRVATSTEGAKALAAREDVAPGVIVADGALGQGGCGFDAVEQIRAMFSTTIPAVVLVGDLGDRGEPGPGSEETLVLHKPFSPAVLRRVLSTAVGRRSDD